MNFYKKDLTFDYSNKDEIKLLIPHVMIETARQTYGVAQGSFEISIECMWNLVTMGNRKLGSRERKDIVKLFRHYLNDDTLQDFNSIVTLDGYWHFSKAHFIKVEMKDITTIFIKSTLAKLPKHLAILLNIQSYFTGDWIYLSFEDLVFKVSKYDEELIDWEKPNWFKRHTSEELADIQGDFICFSSIDNILMTRHNEDKDGLDKPFLARDNFDDYVKELESWGIICKVKTNCGVFDNKIVFCRVEHREVVKQYYIRYDEVGAYAEKKQQEPTKEPKKPTRPNLSGGREKRRFRWE